MFDRKEKMTKEERQMARNAMVDAGHEVVDRCMDNMYKMTYKDEIIIYVCVVGDAMVVYTPYNGHVQLVCF